MPYLTTLIAASVGVLLSAVTAIPSLTFPFLPAQAVPSGNLIAQFPTVSIKQLPPEAGIAPQLP